jgi:hypothetical protein
MYNSHTPNPSQRRITQHHFPLTTPTLETTLSSSLRILRVIGLQRRKNTRQILLPLPERLRSFRILRAIRLQRRQNAAQVLANRCPTSKLDVHSSRSGFSVFGVDFAQGFEDGGNIGFGVGGCEWVSWLE